jgi:hypothetical protein
MAQQCVHGSRSWGLAWACQICTSCQRVTVNVGGVTISIRSYVMHSHSHHALHGRQPGKPRHALPGTWHFRVTRVIRAARATINPIQDCAGYTHTEADCIGYGTCLQMTFGTSSDIRFNNLSSK